MNAVVKRWMVLLPLVAGLDSVHAAPALPAGLTGTWQTAAWQAAGTVRQAYLTVDADGDGVLVGANDAASGTRTMIAGPFHADLEHDTLTIRMAVDPALPPAVAAKMMLTCRYSASVSALACHDPNGVPLDFRPTDAPVPGEVSALMAAVHARR